MRKANKNANNNDHDTDVEYLEKAKMEIETIKALKQTYSINIYRGNIEQRTQN